MSNYPAGVTDNDPHFDVPSGGDEKSQLYGLSLDIYESQVMRMVVHGDDGKPLMLTLEEIEEAQREFTRRNPKGRYAIFPAEELGYRLQAVDW